MTPDPVAPASASAEPVGSPYRFSEGRAIVGPDDKFGSEVALSMASAVNGYVLASWQGHGAGSSSVRVLGRTGAFGPPREATTGTATVLANRRLPGYLAFTKGRRFKATCRRSAATRRTCTVSWRYKRFSYKGRVVVRLSRDAYSTTVSVKRTRLR